MTKPTILAFSATACLALAAMLVWRGADGDQPETAHRQSAVTGQQPPRSNRAAPPEANGKEFRRRDQSLASRLSFQPSVMVGGQVRKPGKIECSNSESLYELIQQAGGATEFGRHNHQSRVQHFLGLEVCDQ